MTIPNNVRNRDIKSAQQGLEHAPRIKNNVSLHKKANNANIFRTNITGIKNNTSKLILKWKKINLLMNKSMRSEIDMKITVDHRN
jgi:hypothetical protein